ncbi:MAG: DUF504 domain-containing protein [Candidatus Aenigmarchaeota archaeon]|nr:DUF504 domain-containing protein [Candidatus Aenigmarchaeota archaeon]
MVFQTLNRLKWTGRLNNAEITFIHRGAENNLKTVEGDKILEVKKTHFTYKSNGKEIYIPNHRVIEIRLKGVVIWKRKTKNSSKE